MENLFVQSHSWIFSMNKMGTGYTVCGTPSMILFTEELEWNCDIEIDHKYMISEGRPIRHVYHKILGFFKRIVLSTVSQRYKSVIWHRIFFFFLIYKYHFYKFHTIRKYTVCEKQIENIHQWIKDEINSFLYD